MDYRKSLLSELRDLKGSTATSPDKTSVSLEWKAAACNAIRDVLEGRPVEPAFWISLKNCTQPQMECVLSVRKISCFVSIHNKGNQSIVNQRYRLLDQLTDQLINA